MSTAADPLEPDILDLVIEAVDRHLAGGNILTLQKLLGHGSPAMTTAYAHLAPDFITVEMAHDVKRQVAGVVVIFDHSARARSPAL